MTPAGSEPPTPQTPATPYGSDDNIARSNSSNNNNAAVNDSGNEFLGVFNNGSTSLSLASATKSIDPFGRRH